MEKYFLHMTNGTKIEENLVACIGYFDGLHRGHQALVQKTLEVAKQMKVVPTMISFEPDPRVVIKGISNFKHIMTMSDRFRLAEKLGIEKFVLLDFTKEMAALKPQAFIDQILGQLHLKGLVCGFDFHFGQYGQGDYHFLQKQCDYPVFRIDKVEDQQGKISSTRIGKAIQKGRMEEVNHLLGREYSSEGRVIRGLHNGHSLHFPTANIDYSEELILPKVGVYGGYVLLDGIKKLCMINLGHNPSVQYQKRLSLEVHILDYKGDLYDQTVRIYWLGFLRDEIHFSSKEELIQQLKKDQTEVVKRWK